MGTATLIFLIKLSDGFRGNITIISHPTNKQDCPILEGLLLLLPHKKSVAVISPRMSGFDARPVRIGFMLEKVAVTNVSLPIRRFSPV